MEPKSHNCAYELILEFFMYFSAEDLGSYKEKKNVFLDMVCSSSRPATSVGWFDPKVQFFLFPPVWGG